MPRTATFLLLALAATTGLSGCAKGLEVKPAEVNPVDRMKEGPGLISGASGNLLDAFKRDNGGILGGFGGETVGMAINPYLWRAALDSVSFMPLLQADSNGGVIVTDWYNPPAAPTERVKLNMVITGKEISIDSLKISMFKQHKVDGDWVALPVSPETVRTLEDALLAKARAMRVADLNKKK